MNDNGSTGRAPTDGGPPPLPQDRKAVAVMAAQLDELTTPTTTETPEAPNLTEALQALEAASANLTAAVAATERPAPELSMLTEVAARSAKAARLYLTRTNTTPRRHLGVA